MNVLDLFSGIGGFSLGLERAGMRTVAFCEVDPFCRAVIRKHWPNVPIFGDVRTLTVDEGWLVSDADERHGSAEEQLCAGLQRIRAHGVDVICGGFPCQDISVAGKGAGIKGERSGLWSEYARIIGEVRPRYVIVENVAALLGRGLSRVLGDLAALGFDAEWHCIPASAVGAPHLRDRVWIVAWPSKTTGWAGSERLLANAPSDRNQDKPERPPQAEIGSEFGRGREVVADTSGTGLSPSWPQPVGAYWRDAGGVFAASDWWSIEPDVGRVAHGISNRVHRLQSLGNAVVPQIPEIIGRAIMRVGS